MEKQDCKVINFSDFYVKQPNSFVVEDINTLNYEEKILSVFDLKVNGFNVFDANNNRVGKLMRCSDFILLEFEFNGVEFSNKRRIDCFEPVYDYIFNYTDASNTVYQINIDYDFNMIYISCELFNSNISAYRGDDVYADYNENQGFKKLSLSFASCNNIIQYYSATKNDTDEFVELSAVDTDCDYLNGVSDLSRTVIKMDGINYFIDGCLKRDDDIFIIGNDILNKVISTIKLIPYGDKWLDEIIFNNIDDDGVVFKKIMKNGDSK